MPANLVLFVLPTGQPSFTLLAGGAGGLLGATAWKCVRAFEGEPIRRERLDRGPAPVWGQRLAEVPDGYRWEGS